MNPFSYARPTTPDAAMHAIQTHGAKFLGGGTNLIDLMKDNVEEPSALVDINHIGLDQVTGGADGVTIGALVRNSDLANNRIIIEHYPLLSHALLAGASPQLRNMATTGGNLMQRTRCYYFMDTTFPACNKRVPGSGCAAIEGFNRIHAILGQTDDGPKSPHTCIATNPSDMCVALYALDAKVNVMGPQGKRTIPVADFHRLPGDDPARDTNLKPDELIVSVTLPSAKFARNSWYLKARDRQSYAFALVSVAAGLEMDGNGSSGSIKSAGLVLGGVALKPWRSKDAEEALRGKPSNLETFQAVAELALKGAHGYQDNAFKIQLAQQCIVRALTQAAQGTTNAQPATGEQA
jgi:xanthine dehydrogenase YagS FAD-binding subunit